MAVFSVQKDSTIVVDGVNYGREMDAAPFHNSVGKEVTGLASKFGDAVNDVRANAGDITGVVAKATLKPQGFDA
jgi:hypothetical protein